MAKSTPCDYDLDQGLANSADERNQGGYSIWMTDRILVTGVSGILGRQAARYLFAQGHEVHGWSRRPARPDGLSGLIWHGVDMLNRQAAEDALARIRPTHILHTAWETAHGQFWSASQNMDWVAATIHLVKDAHQQGLQRIVALGTCVEYDPADPNLRHEFASPMVPHTLYGSAKDATRRALEAFARQFGVSFAWARIFMLYGEGEHTGRFVPSLARALVNGEPARMTGGLAVRDFMETRDAGRALAELLMSRVEGPVNVASGKARRLRDVAAVLAEIAGRPDLLKVGALPMRAHEPPFLVADVTRLTHEVRFRPEIGLEQGLADAIALWRPGTKP